LFIIRDGGFTGQAWIAVLALYFTVNIMQKTEVLIPYKYSEIIITPRTTHQNVQRGLTPQWDIDNLSRKT
jgi:hypothetical protein